MLKYIFSLTLFILASNPVARGMDLHAYWDQRCKECHGHSADFARTFLAVDGGRLVGRHHREDMRLFLSQHQSGGAEAERMYEMLLAQVSTRPIYREKCAGCHEPASELVRRSLTVENGVLITRSRRVPLTLFLTRHGGLTAAEAKTVVEALERIHREVMGE